MAKSVSLNKCKGTIVRPYCRVCLKRDGILPIFGDKSKPDISIEISTFGEVQLQEGDNLPKFICQECFKMLEGAIRFRKSAKRADAILRCRIKRKETTSSYLSSTVKPKIIEIQRSYTVMAQAQKDENTNQDFNPEINTEQSETRIDFVSVQMDETEKQNEKYFISKHGYYLDIYEDQDLGNDKSSQTVQDTPDTLNYCTSLYNCKYCNQSFQSSNEYEQHRTTVEHKRRYVMSFLPKRKSKTSSALKATNSKDYMCEFCYKVFTKQHYSKHMLAEHNIKFDKTHPNAKKECTMCNKMFHPGALNNHVKRIHGKESDSKPKVKMECPICKKNISQKFFPLHLQRHKQGDTKNYVCDQCGKKFFFRSSFFSHRLIHTNTLPYKCEYCPYRGRTKELLKVHVRTHTGDYPYQCTQCETRCSTKSNLNSHMRRHRGPVDFICDVCSRGFYTKIQMERHISVSHYGVKTHICSTCGAAFGYRHGLMSHQRKVHKRPKGEGKPKAVYLQLEEKGLYCQ